MRAERQDLDRTSPVTIWKEYDMIGDKKVRAMVIIFRTRGCWWARKGGCTMCGYNVESLDDITKEDLISQIEKASKRYEGEEMVKVYTSGSFLDDNEFPPEVRDLLFITFAGTERILFETRPEFVTEKTLASIPKDRCYVALGLETCDDKVRARCIKKGFTKEDYQRAAGLLKINCVPVRTYLILKPPFLTEKQAMNDVICSVEFAAPYSDSISINPLNIQAGTPVEEVWRRGDLRPPWLWSLVEVLKRCRSMTDVRIMSAPSGGGTPRGVHNCGICDRKILDAIERFSFSQHLEDLNGLECPCKAKWSAEVHLQGAMRTSVDISKHIEDGPEL
ncbi:MAG: archaeosine biosynthesis radical SAM protein RaSEA [Methanomassiliicoccales archaeon]|nr:MAG: archaeosine biosynthesis radical SAM protein RaSEA [Methanomassiliicoccales archaeon]